MNREIKFRAWDKKSRRMLQHAVPGTLTYFDDNGNAEAVDCDVMQYTGLKDKAGVEIFEGDMVSGHLLGQTWDTRSLVEFRDGYFYPFAQGAGQAKYVMSAEYCHILGNIYENPELLTKQV